MTRCKNTLNFTVFLKYLSHCIQKHACSVMHPPLPKVGPGGSTIYTYYLHIHNMCRYVYIYMYITCLSKLIFCWWKHHVFVDAIFWLGKKTPTFGSSWEPGIAAHGGNATACGGAVHCHLASGFLMAVSSVWFFDQLRSIRYLDQKKNWSFGVDNSIIILQEKCMSHAYLLEDVQSFIPKIPGMVHFLQRFVFITEAHLFFFWGGKFFTPLGGWVLRCRFMANKRTRISKHKWQLHHL